MSVPNKKKQHKEYIANLKAKRKLKSQIAKKTERTKRDAIRFMADKKIAMAAAKASEKEKWNLIRRDNEIKKRQEIDKKLREEIERKRELLRKKSLVEYRVQKSLEAKRKIKMIRLKEIADQKQKEMDAINFVIETYGRR